MAGRDQPENAGARGAEPTHVPPSEPPPGSGYTSNPYDDTQTRAFGTEKGQDSSQQYPPTSQYPPTGQFPSAPPPTAQYTNHGQPYPTQQYPPTGQYPGGQTPTDQFAAQQPGQWSTPPSAPPTHTPPYGVPMPGPGSSEPPPPQRPRGRMWPWAVAALAIFLLVLGGAAVFYMSSIGDDSEAAPRPTRSVAPTTAGTTAPPATSFAPKFVAISGTVESNDGSTLVIKPEDGGASVTVITDADTQVLLGGDGGISSFQPGDGVFVQGGEQQDGRVLAKMIIGSLFGE